VVVLAFLCACLLACGVASISPAFAGEGPAPPSASTLRPIRLYTIGPGSDLFSLYGHSVLCAGETCFDYGIPIQTDPLKLVWHGLRGVPDFAPVRVERARVLAAFGRQERRIEVEELPLDDGAERRLVDRLERETARRDAYAYNPWFANCTTHLRDAIDEASGGRLRAVAELGAPATFRELSEAGFSGRALPLLGITLAVGRGDRPVTPFERMFLPAGLCDGTAHAFGVAPLLVRDRRGVVLHTSVHAGRALLFFVATALAAAVALARRRPALARIAGTLAAIALGLLGAIVWSFSLLSFMPEVSRNANLLVLLPSDALVSLLSAGRRAKYLHVRITIVVVLWTLSAIGVLAQPLGATSLAALLLLVPLLLFAPPERSARVELGT
jgi:hypothetical protein